MSFTLIGQLGKAFTTYPVVRGMLSYSIIWPIGSLVQQTLEGRSWGKCIPTSMYSHIIDYVRILKVILRLVKGTSIQCLWWFLCCPHIIRLD